MKVSVDRALLREAVRLIEEYAEVHHKYVPVDDLEQWTYQPGIVQTGEELSDLLADAADKACKDAEDAHEAVKELIAASIAFYEKPSQIWNSDRRRLWSAIMAVKGMDDPTW